MRLSPLHYLSHHWLSLTGVILVTAATVFWLFLLPASLAGDAHPYLGILSHLILPALFFLGLGLIPIGIRLTRRRPDPPRADWGRLLRLVGLATAANMVLASQFTFRAVSYMDSNGFCGLACHSVMKPEYTSHARGAHSKVECVRCHIGPGAEHFFKAKLSGVRQLASLAKGSYHRPIPAPPANLRAANEICQTCHSGTLSGERIKVLDRFESNEANTRSRHVLLMKVARIHEVHGKMGTSCLECHNRPSHTFDTAANAMDRALAGGTIPVRLKSAKARGVELLTASYPTQDAGAAAVRDAWLRHYPGEAGSADAVVSIYRGNIFPEMKIGWGTYPNHLGHTASPGCFRCHDGQKSVNGRTVSQDCNACHQLLAMDEVEPKILSDLGLAGN